MHCKRSPAGLDEPITIPPDVKAFIARHFDSVVQLELLLLFHCDASRAWSTAEVARELRIEVNWTDVQIHQLVRGGLLRPSPTADPATPPELRYHFDPASPTLGNVMDRVAKLYAHRRLSVIEVIYAQPADTLRTFADAFRIRQEGKDG